MTQCWRSQKRKRIHQWIQFSLIKIKCKKEIGIQRKWQMTIKLLNLKRLFYATKVKQNKNRLYLNRELRLTVTVKIRIILKSKLMSYLLATWHHIPLKEQCLCQCLQLLDAIRKEISTIQYRLKILLAVSLNANLPSMND